VKLGSKLEEVLRESRRTAASSGIASVHPAAASCAFRASFSLSFLLLKTHPDLRAQSLTRPVALLDHPIPVRAAWPVP